MPLADRIYWRTDKGDRALASGERSAPCEYLRILRIAEGRTHSAVIVGYLRQFPDALLADWLSELEELGYLCSAKAEVTQDLDFTSVVAPRGKVGGQTATDELAPVDSQAEEAQPALTRDGVYLAQARLRNRPASGKKAAEIAVLIVEDDADQAALAQLRASTAGYEVHVITARIRRRT